jgi:hypothetical protein
MTHPPGSGTAYLQRTGPRSKHHHLVRQSAARITLHAVEWRTLDFAAGWGSTVNQPFYSVKMVIRRKWLWLALTNSIMGIMNPLNHIRR